MSETPDQINVIVAIDFDEPIMQRLRDISPRLNITQYEKSVPDSAWSECEILYTVRDFPAPEAAPRLRWIQLNYAGVDRAIQKRIVQAEDITVTSASGIHARQIANYCLMTMLAFNYKLPKMLDFQRKAT